MALLNINNVNPNLPSVFREKKDFCPQMQCIDDIKEIENQISDNKTRYVHLDQQVKVNKNKRIEMRHTLRAHKLNVRKLDNFEKKKILLKTK